MPIKKHSILAWTAMIVVTNGPAIAPQEPKTSSDPNVAAFIGDQPITMSDVEKKLIQVDLQLAQSLYTARRDAVDRIMVERLFAKDAEERKVTADDILKQRVAERVKPVAQEDIETFYKTNEGQMGGRTLAQVGDQIKSYLQSEREAEARAALLKELREKNGVRITLQPPRVDVPINSNDPIKGPENAKITIVVFSDFECPYCATANPVLQKIRETYGDKVRIVFRDFPLGFHARAFPAAEAAQCAREQGKFWEYHDKIFANQTALANDQLKKYAVDLGLNADAFNACVDSRKFQDEVRKDQTEGEKSGVTGTPAFFINGRFVSGAQGFEVFQPIIEDELTR